MTSTSERHRDDKNGDVAIVNIIQLKVVVRIFEPGYKAAYQVQTPLKQTLLQEPNWSLGRRNNRAKSHKILRHESRPGYNMLEYL